jgi:radical SAM-linked protein
MRLILRYSKEERVKYISHLDLMRTLQRALRRAEIPVAFSQGFNPHPRLAFASALAVGMTSEGEYMDILLERDMEPKEFCDRMNMVLPIGIQMLEGIKVSDKMPSLMSIIERADYSIKIPSFDHSFPIDEMLKKFLAREEIIVEKKGKKGVRKINIRGMIHHIQGMMNERGNIILKARISTGSKENLKPDLLAQTFLEWAGLCIDNEEPMEVHRLNMYLFQGNRWITPLEIEQGAWVIE